MAAFTKGGYSQMENRGRTHRFTLRLSNDENRILEAKMKLNNDPSKSYVLRKLIVKSDPYEIDYREFREIATQLAKIGNNINQIVKRANETRSIYQTDIDEIKTDCKTMILLNECSRPGHSQVCYHSLKSFSPAIASIFHEAASCSPEGFSSHCLQDRKAHSAHSRNNPQKVFSTLPS